MACSALCYTIDCACIYAYISYFRTLVRQALRYLQIRSKWNEKQREKKTWRRRWFSTDFNGLTKSLVTVYIIILFIIRANTRTLTIWSIHLLWRGLSLHLSATLTIRTSILSGCLYFFLFLILHFCSFTQTRSPYQKCWNKMKRAIRSFWFK